VRTCRLSRISVMKSTTYTVRASAEQARRWARVARYLGYRSVSRWLHELGDEQAQRVDELIRLRSE